MNNRSLWASAPSRRSPLVRLKAERSAVTIPRSAGTAGTYYIVADAVAGITKPDLVVDTLTIPPSALAGDVMTIVDTTRDRGADLRRRRHHGSTFRCARLWMRSRSRSDSARSRH